MNLAATNHRFASVGPLDASRSEETAADTSLVWNQAIFGNLCSLLGKPAVNAIVLRFQADLAARLTDAGITEATRKDAHIITSQAGMLGFTALSQAAKAFEAAYHGGSDTASCLVGLVRARAAVLACIDHHRQVN